MSKEEVKELNFGLYRVYWKKKCGGGNSLAAVGGLHNGDKWIAPCNWTNKYTKGIATSGDVWKRIKKVELIKWH